MILYSNSTQGVDSIFSRNNIYHYSYEKKLLKSTITTLEKDTLTRFQKTFYTNEIYLGIVGKSFGCVDIDIECKIFQY